ncbi:MAG TPA: hypothetical protein VK968_15375 [Roseimicrobium sp.]|nr:hypothetical protein [Roseimicrobium sp.]
MTRIALVLLVPAYVATYLVLLEPPRQVRPSINIFDGTSNPIAPSSRIPSYSHGGTMAARAFQPALWVDQGLFPSRWRVWDPPELTDVFEYLYTRGPAPKGSRAASVRDDIARDIEKIQLLTPESPQCRDAVAKVRRLLDTYRATAE